MPLVVNQVLGAGPFREVGEPTALAMNDEFVVVGGSLGYPQWPARDITKRSSGPGRFPLAAYRRTDLSCLWSSPTGFTPNSIAIHPAGQLAAVGTGDYDGGYCFEGELLIVDLATGRRVSALRHERSIEALAWLDSSTLELQMPPATDDDYDWSDPTRARCLLRASNWSKVGQRELDLDEGVQLPVNAVLSTLNHDLRALSESCGLKWERRSKVWDVAIGSGSVLVAVRSQAEAEAWNLDTGELLWTRTSENTGSQVLMNPAGTAVLTNTVPGWPSYSEIDPKPSHLTWMEIAGGAPLQRQELPGSHLLSEPSAGWIAARSVGTGGAAPGVIRLVGPDGVLLDEELSVSGYDLFNHYLRVRSAPDLLILIGDEAKPWENKWFAAIDPPSPGRSAAVRRLFPLDWLDSRHAFGGPGCFVERTGLLVHAGAFHDGRGLLAGNAFLAAREYPSGRLAWQVPLDFQVSDVDLDGDHVIAILNSGEVVAVEATSGGVIWRETLTLQDRPLVPLCLRAIEPHRYAIGTLDGQIVDVRRAE